VQSAGLTPEHQNSKSEENEKRWRIGNNPQHSAYQCEAPGLHRSNNHKKRNKSNQAGPKSEEDGNEGRFKTTNNTSHNAGSRAYTGATTTRKVIKQIKRVLKSEENRNEGRFKTTNNILHKAESRAYTGHQTKGREINLNQRPYNPKKVRKKKV